MRIPQRWFSFYTKRLVTSKDDKELLIGFLLAIVFGFAIIICRQYSN